MSIDIKVIILKILESLKNDKQISPSNLEIPIDVFNKALEIISDSGFAKNINFAKGNGKILISFYDNAQITLEGIQYLEQNSITPMIVNHKENQDTGSQIFLSYCWDNSDTADMIDLHFENKIKDINIKRDIRDIGEWKSIREFMQSIRENDYAILIISDKYLKSVNCMFEVMEMMKELKFKNKIFPVVLEHKIYDPLRRIEYIQYWEEECKKLEEALKTISIENSAELVLELRKRKQISNSISEFLAEVSDMNNPAIVNVINAIENRLEKDNVHLVETAIDSLESKGNKGSYSYEDIINKVLNSSKDDWNYFDEFGEYIFKTDINLKIIKDDFDDWQRIYEQWATKHPDPKAYMFKDTIFYNNSRIEEFYLVAVDGLRSYIPMPTINTNVIPSKDYIFAQVVNYDGRLDEYIQRSGLVVGND